MDRRTTGHGRPMLINERMVDRGDFVAKDQVVPVESIVAPPKNNGSNISGKILLGLWPVLIVAASVLITWGYTRARLDALEERAKEHTEAIKDAQKRGTETTIGLAVINQRLTTIDETLNKIERRLRGNK